MGDRLATIDMGRKVEEGLLYPFLGRARFPSKKNTMWPGSRPTSIPSASRHDNGPIA